MIKNLANIYLQTEYSLLSSNISLSQLKKIAPSTAYKALAIVDDNMYGAYKFYKMCKEINIKPIIGLRVSVINNSEIKVLLLYAKNNNGYKALIEIASQMKISPCSLTIKDIEKYKKDIVVVIPLIENDLFSNYHDQDCEIIKTCLEKYKIIFEDLYLGISLQTNKAKMLIDYFLELAINLNIKCVAINKTNYFCDTDIETYKILRMIDKNINKDYITELECNSSFINAIEFEKLFKNYPILIRNICEIVDICNVNVIDNKHHILNYKHEGSTYFDSKEYLIDLCNIGFHKRLLRNKNLNLEQINQYKNRLVYELDIVDRMGYNDYFLIVYDCLNFAKNHNILVGPGRGSSGCSLVNYCLGITDIDPVEYNLPFERFLNPKCISMPAIAIDIEDTRKDEIIAYLRRKYGENKIAYITKFTTFNSRLAIKTVGKVLNIDELKLNAIMKNITTFKSVETLVNNSEQLRKMYDNENEIHKLLNLASSIEGLPINGLSHATGIILSDSDIYNYCPVQQGTYGKYQTQYDEYDLEELGLVKLDIIESKYLNVIKNVIRLVKEKQGIEIDIHNISYNDSNVYRNISLGNTAGVFQLDSEGMKNFLKRLKPSSLNDIINAIAIYRPNTKDMIHSFINRKYNNERIVYLDLEMEPALKDTYGKPLFQEQIMMIIVNFTGYSLAEADMLRKVLSKKNLKLIEEERKKFIDKAIRLGKDIKLANKVYDYIKDALSLCFNKSHAIAYSLIAYQMAYLKTYYDAAFMMAIK